MSDVNNNDVPASDETPVISTNTDNNISSDSVSPLETETTSEKKNRMPIIIGVIVLLLAIVYAGGCYYYSSHFPHGIYANGKCLGELSVKDAEKLFTDDISAHSIVVKEKERKETIDAAAIDTKIDVGDQVQNLFDSLNPYLWFTNIFSKKENTLTLDVSYDKDALNQVIKSMEAFQKANIVKPKSCYIQAGETQFEIVPEVLGNKILKDDFVTAVENCLATCKTSLDLEKENLYKLPKYFEDDEVVQKALATANKYTQGVIEHDFTYATETLNYNTSKNWIEISKDFKVTLNESKVGDYVVSLGQKYNTMGSSREFKTANGNTINVYDGDYGWRIDFQKEKKKLIKEIKSGKDVSRKPIYSYTAAVQSEETDIGDSYVEVSISAQELWLFVDGECILDTSVVTGKPGYDTDKGVYGITYKKRDETLNGYNADGSAYASDVKYWMPFNGNQGLHDASWRDDFGGSIYKSNGSHGCVNCPTYAAATLYEYVEENFPVIIY